MRAKNFREVFQNTNLTVKGLQSSKSFLTSPSLRTSRLQLSNVGVLGYIHFYLWSATHSFTLYCLALLSFSCIETFSPPQCAMSILSTVVSYITCSFSVCISSILFSVLNKATIFPSSLLQQPALMSSLCVICISDILIWDRWLVASFSRCISWPVIHLKCNGYSFSCCTSQHP